MTHTTNGYLVQRIEKASNDTKNEDHARAQGYLVKFRALESHFLEQIHPLVDVGLAIDQTRAVKKGNKRAAKEGNNPDIMTIHGCRHVGDLVESLDKLGLSIEEKQGATPLNPLESYILLCAAHLHDVGNIKGRKNHPTNSGGLIKEHRNLFYDTETCQNICDVARVHGGVSEKYGHDTFREIHSDHYSPPRLWLLAAMLRMADELSENPERVPATLLKWFQASPKSKLAYHYAECFRRFDLQNDTLYIQFRIYPDQHKFSKVVEGKSVDFFDHLEYKIDVIEKEAKYCSQYGRPDFDIRRIRLTMEYYKDDFPSDMTNRSTLTLNLDRGYPGNLPSLSERCEELGENTSLGSYCKRGRYEQPI